MANEDRISELYKGELSTLVDDERLRIARARVDWMCDQAIGLTLDLGCSQGITTILLARRGGRVVGVDHELDRLSYAAADLSREEPGARRRAAFAGSEGTRLPFAEGIFDTVILGEIIEHLVRPESLLAEAVRVLKRGGALVITTPFGWHPYHDHKRSFYAHSVVELLRPFAAPERLDVADRYIRLVARKGAARDPDAVVLSAQPAFEEHLREVERELAALRRKAAAARAALEGDKEGNRRLQEETASLRIATTELEAERARLRVALDRADGRLVAFSRRRWTRMGEEVRRARRHPARLPALPVRMARIAWTGSAARAARAAVAEAERALAAGRQEDAVAACDRALRADPRNGRAHQRKREALVKMGEITAALGAVREARTLVDSESLRRAERGLAGRLRELDTAWLPEIPGTDTIAPASDRRVLHVLKFSLPYHTNGYTMRTRYTLRAQQAEGFEPVAVTSLGFPRIDGVADFPSVEVVDGIPHYRLDAGEGFPYRDTPFDEGIALTARMAADVVREVRPALIQARSGFRGYETVLAGLALARRFSLPLVYEISSFLEQTWTADAERAERAELYRLRHAQEVRCMTEADHVITIATSMRDEIVSRGIASSKVTVIPNGVDPAVFAPRAPDAGLRRSLGLEGKVVLGYISNLGAREGIDVLVRATALLAARRHPVACLVVGEGPERSRLEALAREMGVADLVKMPGEVPHERVPDYYALIDLFVVPRVPDRAARFVTPLKPFEAMAMGKPLIVSHLPALLEIAAPPSRGLTFDALSAESLALAAEPLVQDAGLRDRLGEAGRAWVLRERTWEANGRRYRDVYDEVLARHAASVEAR